MGRRGKNIYKRKDGRYEGRYIKYHDISGKAVYGYIYGKRYSDVKDRLEKCIVQQQAQVEAVDMKLSRWLETWLNLHTPLIKPTTVRVYKSHIYNHIIPQLGSISLRQLNKEYLQNFIDNLTLSASTTRTVFSVLKAVLGEAEDRGYISNITARIHLPHKEKTSVMVLSTKQQRQLEAILTGTEDIGVLICLYTGLRIGELCALRWEDIDFDAKILHVNGTQTRTVNGVAITAPKSFASRRIIPLPQFLVQKLEKLSHTGEFVLTNNEKYMDVRTYRRRFKAILKQAGLPDFKFHSLRHTFATRALEVGMDYRTLSEILGHSSVSITLDIYAHSLNEYKKEQMNKMNSLFLNL